MNVFYILLLSFIIPNLSWNALTAASPKNSEKTVFLTGAAGFIGSNFLKYMFDKYPDYKFLVLDSLTYAGNLENIPQYIHNSNRFKFFYGSVTNQPIVNMIMEQSDFVVHFAAESHVTRSIYDDLTFFDTDVLGTRVMMSSLVKHAKKVQRYIHISTSEVCGTAESTPMDEEHPINPRSPYAAAKAGADRLVFAYWCTYNIPALIIRPFNNFGPQQHIEKLIPKFITNALNDEPLTVHGNGNQSRDWIHTLDLARALDLALHLEDFSKIKNQVIHVGSGIATPIIDIAKIIATEFNLPQDKIKFVSDRPGQVECHLSSTKKAKDLLGWEAQIPLEKGIKDTVKWYIDNKSRWEKTLTMQYVPIYTNDNKIEMQ